MTDESTAVEKTETQLPTESPQAVDGLFSFATFAEAKDAAEFICQSSMVPQAFKGNPAEILAAWQYGMELGLPPMQALTAIAVINGTPSLYGDGFMAVIMSSPSFEDCVETFDAATGTATCVMFRHGRQPVTATFSEDDAKRAGLWGKAGPWKQYPRDMLQRRARSRAGRAAFADVLRGMVTVDEANDRADPVKDAKLEVVQTDGVGDEHISRASQLLGRLPEPEAQADPDLAANADGSDEPPEPNAPDESSDMPIQNDAAESPASDSPASGGAFDSPPFKNFDRAIRHAPHADALADLADVIDGTTALKDEEKTELHARLAVRLNEMGDA